jgi:hypothetical protein
MHCVPINADSVSPRSVTILPTYRCTAACEQCCFESNPRLRHRLPLATIVRRIDEAADAFPDLQLVVFSGGEVFLLKDDLFTAIAHAHGRGLSVRCVTNGFWGKQLTHAHSTAQRLVQSGCTEINISTGRDHQRWVAFDSVENACEALVDAGLSTLVTVETDAADSSCLQLAVESPRLSLLLRRYPLLFSLQCNSWMPFNGDYVERGAPQGLAALNEGCTQLFSNVVVNPYDELAACCGLTFEHIPELKLGRLDHEGMRSLYDASLQDFLKIWIHIDGPGTILRKLFGSSVDEELADVRHICQACVILHRNPKVRDALRTRYHEFVPDVMLRWHARLALRNLEICHQDTRHRPEQELT